MTSPGPILVKILAVEFYRRNASLFMLMILFAGGFMRGIDHIILATYFTSSMHFLVIPIAIWLVYTAYVVSFNSVALKRRENAFTESLAFFREKYKWSGCIQVSLTQLLPQMIYGLFLITVGLKNDNHISALIIAVVLALNLFGAAWILNRQLESPDFEQRSGIISRWISSHFIRPFTVFALEAALRRQPLLTIGLKFVGVALLWATLYLYQTDIYDIRLAALGTMFAFALNVNFILAAHEFINRDFPLYRQAPFSGIKRFTHVVVIMFLFTLPELFVLLRNQPDALTLYETSLLYSFGLMMNVLVFNFQYARKGPVEKAMPAIYVYIITIFLCVLGGVALTWLMLASAILSLAFLFLNYDRYEVAEVPE